MPELNPETDTTRFVNIDKDKFEIYINGNLARQLKAGEEQILPYFVAKVGAKHLVDRILQTKGVKDSNRPSPTRDALFAKILPDVAEEEKIETPSDEEFQEMVKKRLEEQEETIASLKGVKEEKDDEVSKLKKELAKLKKKVSKTN